MTRVLLVASDAGFLAILREQFEHGREFAVATAATARLALETASTANFDIVLIDSDLPDLAGDALCRLLRQRGLAAPVLLLGQAGRNDDGPEAGSGADGHIAKPFRIATLLSGIRAQLQRHGGASIPIGPYLFRPRARTLTDRTGGRRIHLTEKETAILEFLYHARGQAATRETLLGEVWGHNSGLATHTLETHIYRLRRKIEPDPANAALLVTDPAGYRLVT